MLANWEIGADSREFIGELQAKLDRMTPAQRRKRQRKLTRRAFIPMQLAIERLALENKVSVARALEQMFERLADGTMQATGRRNSPTAPMEPIPASLFRDSRA